MPRRSRKDAAIAASSRLGALALLSLELELALCELLVIPPEAFQTLKHLLEAGTAWTRREIPKKRGVRVIHAPSDPLMLVSRGILRQVLNHMNVHRAAHGCRPHTSVLTNARRHAGFAKAVYTLDLQDAFPSTTRKRIESDLRPRLLAFLTEQGFEGKDGEKLADAIVDLLLVDDVLPQGFPTSPAVLNLVCFPLDHALSRLLAGLTAKTGQTFRYTRYVDDLTISSDQPTLSKEIRKRIRQVVAQQGWKLRRSKSAYYGEAEQGDEERSTKMPIVTGLVLQPDGRVTIPRKRLLAWRVFLDEMLGKDALAEAERDKLIGIVGFVGMVYEDVLPRIIRDVYLAAKAKFNIQNRRERQVYFED